MLNVLAVLHILVCFTLIALVLLQDPKGGAAGGVFGGAGSNSLLGATGATTFLAKLTRFAAIGFGVLCLVLTWYLRRDTGSVIDRVEGAAGAAPITAPVQTQPAGAVAPAENPSQAEKLENQKGMQEAAPANPPKQAPGTTTPAN